jgi:AraC family transcriptional regulator, positive regulator of tynA and feaB
MMEKGKLGFPRRSPWLPAQPSRYTVMTNREWSTRDVSIRDKFSYWREAVCEAVLHVATENPPENDFFGDIGCAAYGQLRFAAFTSSPHQIVRRASHIARSNHEHYLISLQRSGVSRMQQCCRTCELQAGDIGILDGTQPFNVTFLGPVGRIVAVIPSQMLHSRAPWLRERPIGLMTRDGALHDVLRIYLQRLAGPECGSPIEAELLADNLCNLVALLTARSTTEQHASLERVTDLDRMLAFLRRHLSDADLSPRVLAEHMQVSVRTVHKRFERADITFRQWLLDQRLEACRRALADPRCAKMTVLQIAYGMGFNDLSHFTKAFRARFGIPPGRYRVNHSSAGSPEAAVKKPDTRLRGNN